MDKIKLIKKVNNAIAELEEIRKELMTQFPDYLNEMTMFQLLEGKASVRLLNIIHMAELRDIPVSEFLNYIDRLEFLRYRTCGKTTMLELSRIIKEETGIDW